MSIMKYGSSSAQSVSARPVVLDTASAWIGCTAKSAPQTAATSASPQVAAEAAYVAAALTAAWIALINAYEVRWGRERRWKCEATSQR